MDHKYINQFNEVCIVGCHDTRTRRNATELEIEQSRTILDLEKQVEILEQEIENLKTERQTNYRNPRDLHDRD